MKLKLKTIALFLSVVLVGAIVCPQIGKADDAKDEKKIKAETALEIRTIQLSRARLQAQAQPLALQYQQLSAQDAALSKALDELKVTALDEVKVDKNKFELDDETLLIKPKPSKPAQSSKQSDTDAGNPAK